MTNGLRRRFWPEAGLGLITGVLFLLTLVRRDWIEALFGIDPDNHSGSLEFMIVGGLLRLLYRCSSRCRGALFRLRVMLARTRKSASCDQPRQTTVMVKSSSRAHCGQAPV